MLELVYIAVAGLLIGLNIGAVSGYLWCLKHKRETSQEIQPPVHPTDEVQNTEDTQTPETTGFWQQTSDLE